MTDKELRIKAAMMDHFNALVGLVTQSLEDKSSAHEVEHNIWELTLLLGRQALGVFFERSGQGDVGDTCVLADGRELKRLAQLHSRPYLTVFGEFTLTRWVYAERERQKVEYVPLDERLELPEQKFSYLLQDWDQQIASELPFGKVNDFLSRILKFQQSVNSLEQTNRQLSESSEAFWESVATPEAPEEGAIIVCSVDGKGVVMRPSELDAEQVAQAKKSGRAGHKKIALIGSLYSVDPYERRPEQVLNALFKDRPRSDDTSKRPEIQHKRVRGALLRNSEGLSEPQTQEIFTWIASEARQRALPQKKKLVLIMDGQCSLWAAGDKYLPEDEFSVIEILDLIHASSYIWTATHLFYAKGSAQARAYAKEQIRRLLNNQVNLVIEQLKTQGRQQKLGQAGSQTLEQVCGYLSNNAHRMCYRDYLEQGLPVASGVIEGACRNVVKDRMEQSGMRWTIKGAHAMLSLRSIYLSGLWDQFIQWRIGQETRRLYPDAGAAANDGVFAQARLA